MRSRAPKITHPRRVESSYLLSGLVKCKTRRRAFSGQEAKSGQFAYYVCQSIMKRGKDAWDSPRLNARRFEEMGVDRIRSNILTPGNILALVRVVEEQIDVAVQEQGKRLQTIENEIEDVKRKLDRVWRHIETVDASARLWEHRERRERLEDAAADARGHPLPAQHGPGRRGGHLGLRPGHEPVLQRERDDRTQGIHRDLLKDVFVMPGTALLPYTIPMPDDSRIPGRNAEEMALNGEVLFARR